MNISNPIGPDNPVDRGQNIPLGKSGRAERSGKTEETTRQRPEVQETAQSSMDTVRLSQDVEELTKAVEEMEDTPRQEVINRVEQHIRNGDYNKPEFIEALAVKLVNTNPVNE